MRLLSGILSIHIMARFRFRTKCLA